MAIPDFTLLSTGKLRDDYIRLNSHFASIKSEVSTNTVNISTNLSNITSNSSDISTIQGQIGSYNINQNLRDTDSVTFSSVNATSFNSTGGNIYIRHDSSYGARIYPLSAEDGLEIKNDALTTTFLQIRGDGLTLPKLTASRVLSLDSSNNVVSDIIAGSFADGTNISTNQNSNTELNVNNTTDGTNSRVTVNLTSNNSQYISMRCYSESHNTSGLLVNDAGVLCTSGAANGLRLLTIDSTQLILGTANTARITISSSGGIGFFGQSAVAQQSHVSNPTGGSTVDSEARSAINDILTRLENLGLFANS